MVKIYLNTIQITLCTPRCKSTTPGCYFFVFLLMVRNSTLVKKCVFYDSFFGCYCDMVRISPSIMESPNNLEKISILKKWQLFFYWGVKSYFGEMPLKLCIFRHEIFYLYQYFSSNSYCSHQMESVLYLDDILIIFGDHNTSKTQLLLSWINISMTN